MNIANAKRIDTMKIRLDLMLVQKKLATSRSQAENLIKLGQVSVDGSEKAWLCSW